MKFTFLGTSSGIPTKTRNMSALAIGFKNNKRWWLVDCGEGTQHQLLHTEYSLVHLQAIFITHIHGDHCYGLPGLLGHAAMLGRKSELTIYGPKGIREFIIDTAKHTQLRLGYTLNFVEINCDEMIFQNSSIEINSIPLSHRVPSFAYQFSERNLARRLQSEKLVALAIPPGPLWGKLQNGESITLDNGREINGSDYLEPAIEPRSIIIAGDNDTPEQLSAACQTAQVLVHEATYTHATLEKIGPKVQHSSAKMVAEFAQSVGLKNLLLTHISPRYTKGKSSSQSSALIYDEAKTSFSGNLFLASDFDTYSLNREGLLYKDS